jgi:hypothetical protein
MRYRVTVAPDGTDPAEYYRRQKRFSGQEIDIEAVRRAVRSRQERLSRLAASSDSV